MSTPLEAFGGGVAVITGAGAGIGAGLSRYAATELGMTVVLADVDGTAIATLRSELEHADGQAIDVICDVRDPDAVQRLADRTVAEAGPVRLLVNNAGVEQFGYLWDTPVANWNRLVDININGIFHGIRAFLPHLLTNPGPSWVWNLSSVGGVVPWPLQAPYIMSKHAVLALTECLHQEVEMAGHADHVHVQAVLPGAVTSNIFDAAHGVEAGDVDAAEAQRAAMLAVKAAAMDPIEAAEVIFTQAAAGTFYLMTQPDSVGAAMEERAETLRSRRAPVLPQGSRYARSEAETASTT
ncbi:SDR family oxidoreductase [Nocardia sp. CA-120079]|uniref:SDR family oxidoreductase n=1 Tax=Nocardia sp. CA-120079 TaxID=3239974 RepID=UPI003D9557EA